MPLPPIPRLLQNKELEDFLLKLKTQVEQGFASTNEENLVLFLASIAPADPITGAPPTSLTYDDFNGITNHSKTIVYTSGLPTTITEIFDYDGETWTVTKTVTYTSGNPSATDLTIVRT